MSKYSLSDMTRLFIESNGNIQKLLEDADALSFTSDVANMGGEILTAHLDKENLISAITLVQSIAMLELINDGHDAVDTLKLLMDEKTKVLMVICMKVIAGLMITEEWR